MVFILALAWNVPYLLAALLFHWNWLKRTHSAAAH